MFTLIGLVNLSSLTDNSQYQSSRYVVPLQTAVSKLQDRGVFKTLLHIYHETFYGKFTTATYS